MYNDYFEKNYFRYKSELEDKMKKIIAINAGPSIERIPFYKTLNTTKIDTTWKTIDQVAREIISC